MGFGDDIFKFTMISQRKKQEMLDSIDFLPGHKAKLLELFKKIETVSHPFVIHGRFTLGST